MQVDGFLNMLKPPGMTSHDVVVWARSRLGMKRIGHLGTLDPVAAGVLPLSLGRATRLLGQAAGGEKAYRAEIVFGLQTDTLDAEGRVISITDASALVEDRLRSLLPQFIGEIEQTPPAFSAVSVGGRRLHERARAGHPVVAGPRRVTIHHLDLVEFVPGHRAYALVDVLCGSGTYIRTLADDLGRATGYGACLGFLVRTHAGRFDLAESRTLEEIAECSCGCILPVDWPLVHLPEITLDAAQALAFIRGNVFLIPGEPHPTSCMIDPRSSVVPSPRPSETLSGPNGTRKGAERGKGSEVRRVRTYGPARLLLGLGEIMAGGLLQPRIVLRSESELTP